MREIVLGLQFPPVRLAEPETLMQSRSTASSRVNPGSSAPKKPVDGGDERHGELEEGASEDVLIGEELSHVRTCARNPQLERAEEGAMEDGVLYPCEFRSLLSQVRQTDRNRSPMVIPRTAPLLLPLQGGAGSGGPSTG